MYKKFGQLFLFILFISNLGLSQSPLLKHYTTNDGLLSSTIYTLLQDKDGFIWFGTDVGVSRFDGKRFHNFTLSDGLSDNYIIAVKSDARGRIWFLGFNGTVSYWLDGKIYNASTDTLLSKIITSTSFIDMFEDNDHKLWFVSQNEFIIADGNKIMKPDPKFLLAHGIVLNGAAGQIVLTQNSGYQLKHNSSEIFKYNIKFKTKMNGGYFRNPDGSVLFVAAEGVIKQNDTSQSLIIPFGNEFLTTQQPGITMSNDSLLWVTATGKGIYCYDYKNPLAKPNIYLKNKVTANILADRLGNIWISTLNDGLYMIPEWGRRVNIFNEANGLPENHCYSIHVLQNDEILIGMNNGETELIKGRETSNQNTFKYDKEPNKVHHILSDKDNIWIASDRGLIHQNKKTKCNHFLNCKPDPYSFSRRISSVKDMSLGNNEIYIVSGFNILKYPIQCDDDSNYVMDCINEKQIRTYSVFCDYSGEVWYGTKLGLQSKRGQQFVDHSTENILLKQRISSIAETEDSILVLATYGYGVVFYKNGKIIHHITTTAGLTNNICRRIFVNNNKVYVATPSGVSVISYSKGQINSVINLNTGNFLPSNDVNDVTANESDIFVATMEGAAIIGLWALDKIRPDIPLLYITEIKVNDSSISMNLDHRFNYHQNSLKFNFIGIYYQLPDEVNYRYKLKDEQEWQYTNNTNLEFSFLAHGTYNFQLQARIQNGNWSTLKSFNFTILSPFWKKPWFLILLFITIGLLVFFIIKQWLKIFRNRKEEKAKMERQITQLEQQALQALLNPHFIFNVMNSIQHFINVSNKEAANRYLADFAKLIRMNLTISLKRYISLEEEIGYLKLYLSFEKLRFGDNLTYEFEVDPKIDISETTVAVMMIQPFIENAIWHGILPMNSKGHILIKIDKESENLLKIRIEDNGVGIQHVFIGVNLLSEKRDSHALSMTMQRLILLGKSSGQDLYIKYEYLQPEHTNKGTVAELMLPAKFY